MWQEDLKRSELFTPHANFCDATEVFVQMGTRSDRGFCIEKAERASAQYWEEAREDCAGDMKRLPEYAEWRMACRHAFGFTNNTADGEWVSNSSLPVYFDGPGVYGIIVPTMGAGAFPCDTTSHGIVSSQVLPLWAPAMHTYRCVR